MAELDAKVQEAARLGEEFQSGSCHAGRYETSLVMALTPTLVDREACQSLPELVVPLHEKALEGARNFQDCGMDRAYCGDPAGATALEGEERLDALADMTVEAVETSLGLAKT